MENEKLLEQKKAIADVNVNITTVQRKIDNIPSKIEITQFHKRLVELFDALNVTSEECKRFVNLFNTVQDSKKFFKMQENYLKEIKTSYGQCKNKKEKEALLHNIKNVLGILDKNVETAGSQLQKGRQGLAQSQASYSDCIMKEKQHYKNIKEFEDECEKNDALRARARASMQGQRPM